MAFFDFISRPIRGIGRMLRGKFKQGLGDLGAGAPLVAAIPGVGLPAALAIGAAGGGVERATRPGANFGNILGGAASGAAGGAAGHFAGNYLRGIGSRVAGGAPSMVADTGVPDVSATLGRGLEGAAEAAGAPVTAATTAVAAPARGGVHAIGRALTRLPGEALRFARSDPKLALGLAQTAASVYGAQQEGEALDREFALREEEMRRRSRPRMPFDQWEAERNRLRGTYQYGAN